MLYTEITNIKCYFTIDNDKTYLGSFDNITDYQRTYFNDSENKYWNLMINLEYNSDNLSQFLVNRTTNIYLTYTAKKKETDEFKTYQYKLNNSIVSRFLENDVESFLYNFKAKDCVLIEENLLPNEVKSRL